MASTSTDLIVPKLGESITEAVVAKWLKKVGEATAIDEPLVDLETDKVSVTLPAPTAGVLSEQRVPAGTTVKVGDVIGIISAGKAAAAPQQVAAQQAPVAAQQAATTAAQSKPSVAERGAQALAAIAATQPAINPETANAHGRTLPSLEIGLPIAPVRELVEGARGQNIQPIGICAHVDEQSISLLCVRTRRKVPALPGAGVRDLIGGAAGRDRDLEVVSCAGILGTEVGGLFG